MNSKLLLLPTALMVAGHSAAEAKGKKSDKRPNILVILADDLGYSDLGCYGSEIHTPNLDKLAQEGVRFNHFYNASRSCPTRASLLTGLYQHQAGIGRMTFDAHLPGYRGTLSRNAVTIAEVLKEAGYTTSMENGMLQRLHSVKTNANGWHTVSSMIHSLIYVIIPSIVGLILTME